MRQYYGSAQAGYRILIDNASEPTLRKDLVQLIIVAKKLGYNPDPQQISDSLYKFSHRVAPASLEIDIITGAFSISFDILFAGQLISLLFVTL